MRHSARRTPSFRQRSPFGTAERPPPADVLLGDEGYFVVLEAPGASGESLEVTPGPVAGTITISARVDPLTRVNGRPLRAERPSDGGSRVVKRTLAVAWDADTARASAALENGLIVVSVPRSRSEKQKADQA